MTEANQQHDVVPNYITNFPASPSFPTSVQAYPYSLNQVLENHLTSPVLPWFPPGLRGRSRRGMLRRAVFSDVQRKTLEKTFQEQKYIGKPERKKLAVTLGLKDSQVKIWFQNRRMKWRNTKERQVLSAAECEATSSSSGCMNIKDDEQASLSANSLNKINSYSQNNNSGQLENSSNVR